MAYPWSSYKVLVPLILGIVGMIVFVYLERFVKYPTVPFAILSNRTSAVGFITTFFHSVVTLSAIYYLPVWFQATKGSTAIQSGVHLFSLSFTIAPMAIVTGISVTILGSYKSQNVSHCSIAR